MSNAEFNEREYEREKAEVLERFLPHVGFYYDFEEDEYVCFCGVSLGGYSLPQDERRKLISLDSELSLVRVSHREHVRETFKIPPAPPSKGTLLVGTDGQGNVVVNHPDIDPDKDGNGHIVFSVEEAVDFAESVRLMATRARSERPA